MTSPLVNAIEFLKEFGFFDVVLPFLLVFSITFAVLEKTRILGVESDGKTPKKQINSMVAFVIGMIVVATNKIVTILNEAIPNIVLLLVMIVLFLMLAGTLAKNDKDGFKLDSNLQTTLVIVSLISIIIILLTTISLDNGMSVWDTFWDWLIVSWSGTIFASILLGLVVIGAMFMIVKPSFKGNKGDDD
ncbi:hypothetical protein KKG24_04995 [Patescibacteria group bacterium]|nr:hypothetical protein [Patescibacteria group bacterium]